MPVQKTVTADIPALQDIVEATGLFPGDMLPEMIAPFLTGQSEDDLWLTVSDGDGPVGFCFARAEPFAEGTWNLLALAVAPARQGSGEGSAAVAALESELRARDGRILIVDTSGTPAFDRTRAFYERAGYETEARIRDYWAPGDDKVTFRKALADQRPAA